MCVFSIRSLTQTEESDDAGFATESTHFFLNIRTNSFQKNPTLLRRYFTPSAVDTKNLSVGMFFSCPLDILQMLQSMLSSTCK